MEVEAQESNSQNDDVVSSSCEIIFALKQEALFFVESHNWNLDAAVSTFQDNNAVVLAAAAELGVENHAAGADVVDAVETESNVAEQEKHTNLRTQDPPPERSMEASCGLATVVFADRGSGGVFHNPFEDISIMKGVFCFYADFLPWFALQIQGMLLQQSRHLASHNMCHLERHWQH
ncbi:hypothetical protein EV1_028047 [Malus domestica]